MARIALWVRDTASGGYLRGRELETVVNGRGEIRSINDFGHLAALTRGLVALVVLVSHCPDNTGRIIGVITPFPDSRQTASNHRLVPYD